MLDIIGTSVFAPLQSDIALNRFAVKRALLKGCKKRSFQIRKNLFLSNDEINRILKAAASGEDVLSEFHTAMSGAPGRVLNCVLLADAQTEKGVILHKQKSGYIAASLPVVSMEEAESDYALAVELACFAEKASGSQVYLHRDFTQGTHALGELALTLALQMDPLACQFPDLHTQKASP